MLLRAGAWILLEKKQQQQQQQEQELYRVRHYVGLQQHACLGRPKGPPWVQRMQVKGKGTGTAESWVGRAHQC